MLFTSKEYWLLFAGVFILYWSTDDRKRRNLLLLAASYVFYGWIQWKLLGLIVLSTLIDWFCSRNILRDRDRGRRWIAVSAVTNLAILGLFKYHDFFAGEINRLLTSGGIDSFSLPILKLVLPVGISFYTFQSMSFTIDVHRGRTRPPGNLLDFFLYVSFFPQLVAGPIERGERLMPQFLESRRWIPERAAEGLDLIVWGLFRKLVLADNLGLVVADIFGPHGLPEVSGTLMLLGIYAFALQIYCDFVAYSDIARGCGALLGFDLSINFRAPYLATSPSDFWRRWHITLSQWLRDYLYIPMGGNRGGLTARSRNLLIVMFLGGLWHGASWIFVIWGLFHGGLLVLQQVLGRILPAIRSLPRFVKQALTFHAVAFGFMIFRCDSLDRVTRNCRLLAGDWSLADLWSDEGRWLAFTVATLALVRFTAGDRINISRWPVPTRAIFYVLVWYGCTLLGTSVEKPFIYFQF